MDKVVFLDRDGVINEIIYHKEMGIIDSPFTLDQFRVLPDVGNAINKFHNMGFLVIIVSNQPAPTPTPTQVPPAIVIEEEDDVVPPSLPVGRTGTEFQSILSNGDEGGNTGPEGRYGWFNPGDQ